MIRPKTCPQAIFQPTRAGEASKKMAGGQLPHDLRALADLGLILKALVELLDHGKIDEERFIREAREAGARFNTILGDSGDV